MPGATPELAARIVVAPIQPLIDRIVAAYDPKQIWLFGSRARGDADDHSDWDLLAVVDDDTPDELFRPEVTWRSLELDRVRADVVLLTWSEFVDDADTPNTLAYPVTREGRLVYER